MVEGTLASSLNKDGEIINDLAFRNELTRGIRMAVLLGGHWIDGQVVYEAFPCATDYRVEPRVLCGFFFLVDGGTRGGLRAEMRIHRL